MSRTIPVRIVSFSFDESECSLCVVKQHAIKLLEVEAEMTSGSKSVESEWVTWCQESSEVHDDWKKKIDEMNRLLDEIGEELSRHIERCQMLKVDLITETTNPDLCNAVDEGVEERMRCDEQISQICNEANAFVNA